MRGGVWAVLWAWAATAVLLLTEPPHRAWANAAPDKAPSTFADIPVEPKPKPKSTGKVIRAGPSRTTLAERVAAERAGPPGTGKSNLACVVFEGRTGIDARSTLYNRCSTGVRLFNCLQYKNGADTCVGLKLDDSMATLWDLLSGQSLVMPATDTLKRWAVFACETPLTPWGVLFRAGDLVGDCVETGLEPPRGAPAPKPTIRSNDPSTWPAGTVNRTCLSVAPVLFHYQMQLINHCARPMNVVICATTNVAIGAWPCMNPVAGWGGGPPTDPGWPVIYPGLPRPSQIVRWSAFGCEDPAVPRNVRYDGYALVGDCVAPPEVDAAADLPRRSGNKATERLSDEMTDEDLAAREQERSAASQAIDVERSRISADANDLLGVIIDVASQAGQAYVAGQQGSTSVPGQGYAGASLGSGGSSGSGASVKVDATSCVSYSYDPNSYNTVRHDYRNTCGFEIQAIFCPERCAPTGERLAPGAWVAFRSKQSASAYRWAQ